VTAVTTTAVAGVAAAFVATAALLEREQEVSQGQGRRSWRRSRTRRSRGFRAKRGSFFLGGGGGWRPPPPEDFRG
jgi:hypothetical protein